jgi:streptogramin lyase
MKYRHWGIVAILAGILAAGCGSGSGGGNSQAPAPMSLQGVVHGGQAPIVGAAVTLYAAGSAQSNATPIASTTTDASGNFSYSINCSNPYAQMYVTSTGGNPGGGANSAIHLMAILGPCQNLHRSVTVNELTTVAAAYAANRFIGPSGCADCGGGPPSSVDNIGGNAPGLTNAMGSAALLANPISGADGDFLPTAADCAAANPPANCLTLRRLNTLGNALAACVNSSGPASSQCVQLFECATPGAAFASSTTCSVPVGATQPADTLQAILDVARNPAKVSPTGLDYTANRDVVFSPQYTAHPAEYTLSVNFNGGGANGVQSIAIDTSGNAWLSNDSSTQIAVLSPLGAPVFGSPITVSNPSYLAIDLSGNVWIAQYQANAVTELNPTGGFISAYSGGGLDRPVGVAVDPSGNIWVANDSTTGTGANSVTELNPSGVALSTASGYTGGGLNAPFSIALDQAGNAWAGNLGPGTSSVTELTLNGTPYSNSPISGSGISSPYGIAIDPHGNAWVANSGSSAVVELSPSGSVLSGASGFTGGGLNTPAGIAIDAANNAWIGNTVGSLVELGPDGAALSPSSGFTGPGLTNCIAVAIDPSGNVWVGNHFPVTNTKRYGVTVFLGAAAPTRTPLVAALTQGFSP